MGYLIGEHRMGTVYTQLSMQERRRIEGWWHCEGACRRDGAGIETP